MPLTVTEASDLLSAVRAGLQARVEDAGPATPAAPQLSQAHALEVLGIVETVLQRHMEGVTAPAEPEVATPCR